MSREAGASGKSGDILGLESSDHEACLFKCRMAENAERFDDMVEFIQEACRMTHEPLGPNERNYLSVAYKNSVGARRAALRCLTSMRSRYEGKGAIRNVEIINSYIKKVMEELERICNEVLTLISGTVMRDEVMTNLKDDRSGREFKVFFLKMNADYYRYLSEFASGDKRREAIDLAAQNYEKANEAACVGADDVALPPPHPIRLGLSLNYSVFLYEIQDKPEEAKRLAKQAFDDALDKLDSTGELEYKDSTLILQLLRDNSTLWSAQDTETQQQQQQVAPPPQAAAAAAAPTEAAPEAAKDAPNPNPDPVAAAAPAPEGN